MTTPIVRLSGVSKRFPVRRKWLDTLLHPTRIEYQQALDPIDLEIRAGETFGLLGQNGAGKTTLFKILATLVLPDEGTAEVAGIDVVRHPSRVRDILTPVIPNERSLYWRLNAVENLRLYAALHGSTGEAGRKIVEETLHVVGLDDAGEKQVGLFSSGMRQRLLVARALLSHPKVLLLDEPTRSMDPVGARDFRAFIREEIIERQRCTVLLATHDHHEVADLCTRIGILEKGRLLAVGAAGELVEDMNVQRYQLWTRDPDHPEVLDLPVRWGAERIAKERTEQDGWTRIGFDLPPGADHASALLGHLSAAGVTVSRFEKVELPLADLIERVASQHPDALQTARDR